MTSAATDELLAEALAGFGVTDARVTGSAGLWGDHHRVRVDTPDGQRFFLRERPWYLSHDRFVGTVEFQYAVAAHGCAAAPVRALDGDLTTVADGRRFSLVEYVPDDVSRMPVRWLAGAAWALHRAIDTVPPNRVGPVATDLAEHAPEPSEVRAYTMAALSGNAAASLSPATRRRLLAVLDAEFDVHESVLVHGDVNENNVRTWVGRPLWIDFDNAHLGERRWEVAKLAAYRAIDDVVALREPPPDCYAGELAAGYPGLPAGTRVAMPLALLVLWVGREDLDDLTVDRNDRDGLDTRAALLCRVAESLLP